jgi:hypothetical protein
MPLSIPDETAINGLYMVGSPIPFTDEPCSGLDDPGLCPTRRDAIV